MKSVFLKIKCVRNIKFFCVQLPINCSAHGIKIHKTKGHRWPQHTPTSRLCRLVYMNGASSRHTTPPPSPLLPIPNSRSSPVEVEPSPLTRESSGDIKDCRIFHLEDRCSTSFVVTYGKEWLMAMLHQPNSHQGLVYTSSALSSHI